MVASDSNTTSDVLGKVSKYLVFLYMCICFVVVVCLKISKFWCVLENEREMGDMIQKMYSFRPLP